MSEAEQIRAGGCRCGAVRYRARGKPKWQAHCHCKECRGQTGAAFASWLGYETGAVTWEKGRAKEFVPSPGVVRAFCGDCGTPLFFVGARWPGEIHVLAGTLDDPASVAPAAHTYLIDAVPWATVPQTAKRFWRTPKEGGPLP
jgi:hypothetical protein